MKKMIPPSVRTKIKKILYQKFGFLNVNRPYVISVDKSSRFKDMVCIVTGGSGAIGRAISCRLAAEGAIVYVCGMTESKINAVVHEISEFGGKAIPCTLNVTNEKDIIKTFESIIQKHDKIDVIVTSAGGSARERQNDVHEQDPNIIREVIDINLIGSILCTQQAAKQMITKSFGKVIMLSSAIGSQGKAGFSEYSAAKGGVITYVKSLAMELGKYGINVNCVSPGIVQRDKIYNKQLNTIKNTNYLDSFGKPEDISNMVAFLASEEASFITGQNFIVDGGRSLGLKGE